MRRRLLNSVLLIGLAAAAAAAQQSTRVWLRIVPDGEEFAVHFPEPNFRIRRELPFGGSVTLKPASFEVMNRGAYLSVLSFSKSEAGAPGSLDAFVKGFKHALGLGSEMEFDREVALEGRRGRQFRLKVGVERGSARVFETEQHYYVVLTSGGGKEAAGLAEHFHDSFSLNPSAADRVPLGDQAEIISSPVQAPKPLWPVANAKNTVVGGHMGTTDRSPLVHKPQPVYPPIARAARAQGTVTVQILVDEEGYVISATALSGHPLLQHASILAARQARFSPTRLSGQPVKVSGTVTYNFVLQ